VGFRLTNGYVINIGDASAISYIQFSFEKTLNGMSNGQIALDGIPISLQSEYDVEKEINIYKNGNLKFRGKIIDRNSLIGGGIVLTYQGIELDLADKKVTMSGRTKVWTATTDFTIMGDLLVGVTGWTLDVTFATATTVDSFRVSATESCWNGIIRLLTQTGKDIYVDQENKIIYFYDELTQPNKFAFVEGQNAKNISDLKSRSKAGKVIVYGKGDGDFQTKGSYGSSLPEHVVIDRNIISEGEANTRAEKEYNRINPQQHNYSLTPLIVPSDLTLGDAGTIDNNSAGINDTVHIVRIKYTVDGIGTEDILIQVTNPELRIARRSRAEMLAGREAGDLQNQSSMQGSGNTLTWGRGINAQSGAPLKLPFYIPSEFIENQAGIIDIKTMNLDYNLDGYNSQYGDAEFTGSDPQVQNSSADEGANVTGDSGDKGAAVYGNSSDENPDLDSGDSSYSWKGTTIGTDSDSSVSCSNGVWTTVCSVNTTNTDEKLSCDFYIKGVSGGAEDIQIRIKNSGELSTNDATYGVYVDGFRDDVFHQVEDIGCGYNDYNDAIYLQVKPKTGAITVGGYLRVYEIAHEHSYGDFRVEDHDHGDGSYMSATHSHGDGDYAAVDHDHGNGDYDINAADLNHITMEDDVTQSGTVNSTSINIKLYYLNGSSWVLKNSILNTGKTIDSKVDLTNGGVYPDVPGYWKVEIEPNSSSPDFAQAIININHNLEN